MIIKWIRPEIKIMRVQVVCAPPSLTSIPTAESNYHDIVVSYKVCVAMNRREGAPSPLLQR
jgi:hypothetical protein